MIRAQSWLPANALFDDALNAHLRAIVDAWAQAWLPSPRRAELRQSSGETFPAMSEQSRSWAADDMSLVLDTRAPLGPWLLGLPNTPQRPSDADAKLMAALSTSAVLDLFARFHKAFGLQGEPRAEMLKRPAEDALVFSI